MSLPVRERGDPGYRGGEAGFCATTGTSPSSSRIANRRLVIEPHRRHGDLDQVVVAGQRIHDHAVVFAVVGDKGLAQRRQRELHPAGLQVRSRRHLRDLDLVVRQPLDVAQRMVLARLHQRDRNALAPSSSNAPDTMHVGLGGCGQVVVDDVCQPIDVQATGCDVGRDQQLRIARTHAAHHLVARLLRHAAVQGFGLVAAGTQRLGELVHLGARAAEDERRGGRLEIENPPQRGDLRGAGQEIRLLPHLRRLTSLRRRLGDANANGVALVALGDGLDPRRHRRGEEHGLPFCRRLLQHRLDVLGESHIQHLVGLVQHHDAHAAHHQAPAPQVVERAARSCNHHVHAGTHRMQLPADRLSAIDRHHAHAQRLSIPMNSLGDLHRQLARRHQHDGDRPLGAALVHDALQDREGERGGLAGAGRSLAEEVLTRDQGWDGLLLDRRGFFVAEGGQGRDDFRVKAEGGEACVLGSGFGHPAFYGLRHTR